MKLGQIKATVLVVICLIVCNTTMNGQSINPEQVSKFSHPRLLLLDKKEREISKVIQSDARLRIVHDRIIKESNRFLNVPPVTYKKEGKRLLAVSREALKRIYYLSYAFRITQRPAYLQRAEREMLAVSAFQDWNPTHFLDVAEMTTALSIGYDWLYSNLSDQSRKIISAAILERGIKPSLDEKYNAFLTRTNNWNQVCNAGMLFGAIAVYESNPALADSIIRRSIHSVKLSMQVYGPDGAYPEGYGYWSYGTSFNVMLLDALEKLFGQDFGLSEAPGFLKTAAYFLHMVGINGANYNYSDSGILKGLEPTMYWFAGKTKNSSLLFVEREKLNRKNTISGEGDRLLPNLLVWNGSSTLDNVEVPKLKMWVGQGETPVALMRSTWTDKNGIFLGFKGGSASTNHAHMDIGSFVMEAEGRRWALDPGMQSYGALESKGLKVFSKGQNADRWKIFRMTNYVHNTLTINGELQKVKGFAPLQEISKTDEKKFAKVDLSTIYPDYFQYAFRFAGIIDNKFVEINDSFQMKSEGKIRWNMLTKAKVSIEGNTAVLSQKGKKLIMVLNGVEGKWQTWSTHPPKDYDAPMPGTSFVGFEIQAPANATISYTVTLIPGSGLSDYKKKSR